MFVGLFKPKFYKKCKEAIKITKTRLDTINRKRGAVLKFLKADIADLLRNDLDENAYRRVEGLIAEQNITHCYELINEFCGCILDNLSNMIKQSECPEECREAVASLAFAAARFADLPELRNLRSLFSEKYGKWIESFVNKEFASRMRPETPSKETKVELMRDIALEFSIEWDSKALEQKLFTPPTFEKLVRSTDEAGEEKVEKEETVIEEEKRDNLRKTENKFGGWRIPNPKENGRVLIRVQSSEDAVDGEDRISPPVTDPTEEKPSYRNIPPPYVITNPEQSRRGDQKPKPQSVRQRRPKPPLETNTDAVVVEEEKILDGLLRHYSNKKSLYESDATDLKKPPSSWRWKGKESETEPKRAVSLEQETVGESGRETKEHRRTASLQPEMFGGHVHPKLPEYEDLAARIADLRRS